MSNEISFRTSRKKFIYLYIFGLLVLILFPSSQFSIIGGVYNYLFYALIFIIVIYPESYIIYTEYFVGKDVIIETKGYLAKRRTTIPISSISHVVMNKTITGSIINYGDIVVTSFTDLVITFKGVSQPDKLLFRIEGMMEINKRKI